MSKNKSSEVSLGMIELLIKLGVEIFNLLQAHINLVKFKAQKNIKNLAISIILFIFSLIIFNLALIFSGILLIITFSVFIPLWWAVLAVTTIYFAAGIICFLLIAIIAKNTVKINQITIQEFFKTFREAKKWVKNLKLKI